MDLGPQYTMTAIGSLPHIDPVQACALMLDALPDMPTWPQLPKRSFLENMYVQFSEGLPGVRVDEDNGRIWFQVDESLDADLEGFYQAVIDEDIDRFAMSEEYAAGLHYFLSGALEAELEHKPFVKGQVTGPISFGLTVTDQNRRASLYNETLEQVIVKGLTLKSRWQSYALRRAAPGAQVVMFFDEPYLVSVGSALISVGREQVVRDISECLEGSGADLTGVHCCGNTDWSILFETGVDIVNFDAFEYLDGFIAYNEEINEHVKRGGLIAWGVVPNDERAFDETGEMLAGIIESAFDTLEARGVDRAVLASQSIISPACGLG
ncbi:MAG: methionine synthase, partial [Actinobacteria bacterium]|nr:methionine synthase [Actinomycetota bacterium]